ncbi:hypothetical protein K7J14_00245 [Treponema zuelzerae]|uniref:HepT-like domain-containing protein n=1 Tax=Teretinema zuelzerae TaxID=156 RepID=A0AAE3JIH6_9SPIR|nr:hypothetical protein [Teretinema zuelzerae]MCD1653140.1 hypothetical protein [Teretinema zuelzerae]
METRRVEDIMRLKSELELDASLVEPLVVSNRRAEERIAHGSSDELDYAALGYTIHNIYGCVENTCYRISKFFENGLSRDSWQKDLLSRMILDIQGVRPRFFSHEENLVWDEIRAFRHVFRNLYNRPFDSERLMLLQKNVPGAVGSYTRGVKRYLDFLDVLASELESYERT